MRDERALADNRMWETIISFKGEKGEKEDDDEVVTNLDTCSVGSGSFVLIITLAADSTRCAHCTGGNSSCHGANARGSGPCRRVAKSGRKPRRQPHQRSFAG